MNGGGVYHHPNPNAEPVHVFVHFYMKKKYIKKIGYADLKNWLELKIKKESLFQKRMRLESEADYFLLNRLKVVNELLDRIGEKQYNLLLSDVQYINVTKEQEEALEAMKAAYDRICEVFPETQADAR